ncbi:Arginine metabolism regulation protein II [Fusarium austroafricanum]|uniref:Arginine metabolism regulation protein II n=1 Tax=Fusarium austroafricanum TaxID=2364996 RepID=A0A8H4KHB6_9HYPO|nr:Arginine metabolism regulation protein II [Fusarium austroafricanum]
MVSQGCGTCRARKVRCDQSFPKCNRCIKAGRVCKGYGLQLSWPRRNDTRRAIVGPEPKQRRPLGSQSKHRLVNTSFTDITLHDLVSTSNKTYGFVFKELAQAGLLFFDSPPTETVQAPLQIFKAPAASATVHLNSFDQELFQYFIYQASYSITAFGHDAPRVREVMIRMALSDISPSSIAILQSALSLASFHRGGGLDTTARYKIAAIQQLAKSTKGDIGLIESACHIAAGVILYTLEIHQTSMESNHWLWWACGTTKIVKTAGLDNIKHAHDQDLIALVGCVHYSNTMGRFSLRHWQPNVTIEPGNGYDEGYDTFHPAVCTDGQPITVSGTPHEILYLLSEVFNTIVMSSDPRYRTEYYKTQLQTLDWRLRRLGSAAKDTSTTTIEAYPSAGLEVELYRLSTLIYLRRASAGILSIDQKFRDWVKQAFILLEQLPACQWPFPLLIFGCEAQTDDERVIILDIIHRTAKNKQYWNIATVKRVIETVWVQKDLYVEEMDYIKKLGVILSSTEKSVPAFV